MNAARFAPDSPMRSDDRKPNRSRLTAYLIVALVALIAGLILGQLSQLESDGVSRIGWPRFTNSPKR
ncbi:MAG TPA: hypothetical protein VHD62_19555 [Opitutaceae bacterium]|nr:hypothetical protein [Opitutaceae bacterium]